MSEKLPSHLEAVSELTFGHIAPEVWKALDELPRAGWVKRGVKNPESVKDHIIALRQLALSFEGLSDVDRKDLAEMLEVHDWPEAIHGDEIILTHHDNYESRKLTKAEKELTAMKDICGKLGEAGDTILKLWVRFETSGDTLASLGHELDKYQAIEKALEYEQAQGIPLFKEFFEHNGPFITNPVLVKRLRELHGIWESTARKLYFYIPTPSTSPQNSGVFLTVIQCFHYGGNHTGNNRNEESTPPHSPAEPRR